MSWPTDRCIVCDEPICIRKGTMCGQCGEAYDRTRRRQDGSIIAVIAWAAGRARRIERKRKR